MKKYISTRGGQTPMSFLNAIVQGIGNDGGLMVPDFGVEKIELEGLCDLDYVSLATRIISRFVDTENSDMIREACIKAYDNPSWPREVVPVRKVGDIFVAELFHGRTCAFKDVALSILPYLMTMSLKALGEQRKVTILAATSGDTGKAALEGFKDVEGTSIIVFYPTDGVSSIQKKQMVTQEGANVRVVGINGNFDDAQSAVKKAFANPAIKAACEENEIFLSSANSINIGRLLPQIVYYFSSYISLVNNGSITIGDKVNFCIPSGNFGDCLGGWIAKEMGLPVNKFIVASNKNNILTDFFNTGVYDTRRPFYKTNAPAMDILVSSNLERLLWFMDRKTGHEGNTAVWMKQLSENGVFQADEDCMTRIHNEFHAAYADETDVTDAISKCYKDNSYVLDTHTACGYTVLNRYRQSTGDMTPAILMSTASPYKFPESVFEAVSGAQMEDIFGTLDKLAEITGTTVPAPLDGLKQRKELHTEVIEKNYIPDYIIKSINKN